MQKVTLVCAHHKCRTARVLPVPPMKPKERREMTGKVVRRDP